MKDIVTKINENRTDDAISNAFKLMNTSEDIEALGEEFGRKYSKDLFGALVEFLDGIEVVTKDDTVKDKVIELRNYINK